MVKIKKFLSTDVALIDLQKYDKMEFFFYKKEYFELAEKLEHSYTMYSDGKVLCCCFYVPKAATRGEWCALISESSGPEFVGIVRAMKRLINLIQDARMEMTVVKDFEQAHRLAKILGFELEAETMRKYGVTGLDYSLYARVK
jgi:hypothetical protein